MEFTFLDSYQCLISPKFTFVTKLHVLWYIYQYITFIPLTIVYFYRLINTNKESEQNQCLSTYDPTPENIKDYPMFKADIFIRIFLIFPIIFYVVDSILKYNYLGDTCKVYSLIHHLCTLYGTYLYIRFRYYPWFTLTPVVLHCYLIMFPAISMLNYVYFITVLICIYKLSVKPFNSHPQFVSLKKFVFMLLVPLLLLWQGKCSNVLVLEQA